MHHIYTGGKGDPLCPLGFHPQVRWPTRCKRCFRDYKEHGTKGKDSDLSLTKDDLTKSTPSLSSWSSNSSRNREEGRSSVAASSTSSDSKDSAFVNNARLSNINSSFSSNKTLTSSSSWTSTPDLGNASGNVSTTVSVTLPRRRVTSDLSNNIDVANKTTEFTIRKRTYTTDLSQINLENDSSGSDKSKSRSTESSDSKPKIKVSASTNTTLVTKPPLKKLSGETKTGKPPGKLKKPEENQIDENHINPDVEFILRVKSSKQDSGKKTNNVVKQTSSVLIPQHTSSSSSSSGDDLIEEEEDDDATSMADTETTETTLVGKNDSELLEEVESLKNELEMMKTRCERVEREKSDILLRRLASFDTTSTKTAASEVLKLQQKVNELSTQSEDLKDDNKSLSLKVRELERELEDQKRSSEGSKRAEELQAKLAAAETLCEELMDENEEMKKELRELEDEIEEMQDNFREDQADEYSSLKKELEQTTKNCRILSFKLRKSERKAEQLESEKLETELKYKELLEQKGGSNINTADKIKRLEGDLKVSNDLATRLTKELEEANKRLKAIEHKNDSSKNQPAVLNSSQKPTTGEKVSRASLTRGGSQEDPQQLLRDLQDSLEREADLREQLRFAEEELTRMILKEKLKMGLETVRGDQKLQIDFPENSRVDPDSIPETTKKPGERIEIAVQTVQCSDLAEEVSTQTENEETGAVTKHERDVQTEQAANLRKKAARVEEDNDSLALQLKKMATKAKTARRQNSPSTNTRTPKPVVVEKDEGISDEEDPAELKVLLELNEQESAILRKKVEELETSLELHKKKIKDLEEKLASATTKKFGFGSLGSNASILDKEKVKAAEQEVAELRKKLIEKERETERLENEIQLSQKKTKGTLVKSQSLDLPKEEKALDVKRQMQLVEQEAAVLRTKITTLEADNEKLSAENKKLQLLMGAKKSTGYPETGTQDKVSNLEAKLSDSEKQIKDLKEKLEKLEGGDKKSSSSQGKVAEVEKLKKELKTKTDELEKTTKESKSIQETLKRLREDAMVDVIEFYKSRKPKKPTDLTTKLQLKKMVEDLENEIGDVLIALKRSHSETSGADSSLTLKSELEDKKRKIKELEEKIEESKKNLSRDDGRKKLEEEKNKLETEMKKLEDEKRKVEINLNKLEKEKEVWKTEKKTLEAEMDKLNAEKSKLTETFQKSHDEIIKKLDNANKQLEEEKENSRKLSKQVDNLEKDNSKLQKDVTEKMNELSEMEKKVAEVEEKLKKNEKSLTQYKTKVSRLEKTVEELEEGKTVREKQCKVIEKDLTEIRGANTSLKTKITDLEAEVKKSRDTIKTLEETIRKEREKATDECIKAGSIEKKEITALREDLSKKEKQLDELNEKLEKLEKAKKAAEESHKKAEAEVTKEKNSWEKKAGDLETDLNAERKKIERMKVASEKEQKNREAELSALKAKIKTLETSSGTSAKIADEWTVKNQKLQAELEAEKRKYDDLTIKYELLEEEHVVTKAQLVMEKEHAQNQVGMNKKEITTLEVELKSLQDTLATKQEVWAREKKELQERVKGTTEKATKACEAKWELERAKLQAINEEQISLVEQLKQQNEAMVEQMDHMRKENEELRKKLDDFDKVSKIQRQMSADTTQLELQLREVRGKLAAEEQNHKSEMAALKLRYESRVNLISEELQTSQNHVSRFKRERDTYKHMLEEAQSQMAELKKGSSTRSSSSDVSDELRDSKTAVAALEQQVSCMEDELSEARLECSKLKTELVSEKSAWEVKLSELQSKVNELEEEKILSSGRTKVVGLRTKMELAWQKEREDQQRLLQETSTLARDLRQTLYEVERERDKERLESKRRQEQIKRASEEEMEENRKKITELQCDLLELRDAHAKLRTTNEKLRREKEKWDKENRILQRSKIRSEEEDRKLQILLDNIDLLLKASFDRKNTGRHLDPSSKKRAGSKSRESSPMTSPYDESSAQVQSILQRLNETAEDIRAKRHEEDRDEERSRRSASVGFRRAASTESDTILDTSATQRRPTTLQRKNTLHRKSLSLSETVGPGAQDQAIWKEDDNGGSLTSLEEHMSSRLKNIGLRENSMDSRLSGGSTQSEVLPGDKKKKKGLFGKLKKLSKSKSIEDPTSSQEDILKGGGSDSDMSTAGDSSFKSSKKDLKGKLAGMFKKDSSSRSNSLEQLKKSEEHKTNTLPRSSPGGGSTPAKSATLGRPLDKTKNPAASLLKKP